MRKRRPAFLYDQFGLAASFMCRFRTRLLDLIKKHFSANRKITCSEKLYKSSNASFVVILWPIRDSL